MKRSEEYLNKRAKLWRESAPFYLDFHDIIQLTNPVSDFVLGSSYKLLKENINDIFILEQLECNSTISNLCIKYPDMNTLVTAESLLNFDCFIISIQV